MTTSLVHRRWRPSIQPTNLSDPAAENGSLGLFTLPLIRPRTAGPHHQSTLSPGSHNPHNSLLLGSHPVTSHIKAPSIRHQPGEAFVPNQSGRFTLCLLEQSMAAGDQADHQPTSLKLFHFPLPALLGSARSPVQNRTLARRNHRAGSKQPKLGSTTVITESAGRTPSPPASASDPRWSDPPSYRFSESALRFPLC